MYYIVVVSLIPIPDSQGFEQLNSVEVQIRAWNALNGLARTFWTGRCPCSRCAYPMLSCS